MHEISSIPFLFPFQRAKTTPIPTPAAVITSAATATLTEIGTKD